MATKNKDMIAKPATGIRAIAEKLGVSVATVDRALHNRGRISEKTRAQVLRMVKEIEYKPNLAARNLRLNKCLRISIHLPTEIEAYFGSIRAGIEEGAAEFGSVVELEFRSYERSSVRVEESIRTAIDVQVDGMVVVPPNTRQIDNLVSEATKKGIPTICVSTDAPESGRLTAVTAHPLCCGAMAAEVLTARMKKRSQVVILAGNLENLNQTEKIRGFRSMLAQIAPSLSVAAILEMHDDAKMAYRGIRTFLQSNPEISGIYVSSANSIPALVAVRELGRLKDISVVTTDIFPELVPFIRDGDVKATIFQSPKMQGKIAIQTMYRYLMEGTVPPSSISVNPQIIMRSNLELYEVVPVVRTACAFSALDENL